MKGGLKRLLRVASGLMLSLARGELEFFEDHLLLCGLRLRFKEFVVRHWSCFERFLDLVSLLLSILLQALISFEFERTGNSGAILLWSRDAD